MARLARVWHQRIRSLARRRRVDEELDRELAFHLDQLVAEKIAEGLWPTRLDESRSSLRQRHDDRAQSRRATCCWFDDLRHDVAYGWRILRRPGRRHAVCRSASASVPMPLSSRPSIGRC
jgi:hypothetical protein